MFSRQNVKNTKWIIDKMAYRQDDIYTRRHIDKMAYRKDGK